MRRVVTVVAMVLVVAAAIPVVTQEREDRSLLPWDQLRSIINEVSGERAMHAVLDATPYPRIRSKAELEKGPYRETEVMLRLAKEFGYSDAQIEVFGASGGMGGGNVWSPTQAELWLVAPRLEKLHDAFDIAVSVASNSASGDVTADLVDVGIGDRPEHYAGKDVAGKVVLGQTSPGTLQRLAVFERGAAGVIGSSSSHGDEDFDQIGSSGISAMVPPTAKTKSPGFGWVVSTRTAHLLAKRLGRGETLKVRSLIMGATYPVRQEAVWARIPGDGSSTQAVVVSGHLYEGITKQGANDDMSGCAVSLEFGRALIKLIAEGKLPKPKRDIYFLWVPEISGSRAWLTQHPDIKTRLIANLNFDMEAIGLAKSGSYWTMVRTPDHLPSFINDVSEHFMRLIAEVNRERIHYRGTGYGPAVPVWAPRGSRDPFYISVDRHYGASDHVVFLGERIPAVMFITWPDLWYHTSEDTPDKLDSTQFKRVGVVGAAAAATIAMADDTMALKIAAESLGNGTARTGLAQKRGLGYLADLSDPAGLADAYANARTAVRHQVSVEKGTVASAGMLMAAPAEADKALAPLVATLDQRATALQTEIAAFARMKAAQFKVPFSEPPASELELRAARTMPEAVGGAQPALGFGGGGGRGGQTAQAQVDPDRAALMTAMRRVPNAGDIPLLVAQKKSVLEIHEYLAGAYGPVALADLFAYFEAAQKLGTMKLVEKPDTRKKGAKPPVRK